MVTTPTCVNSFTRTNFILSTPTHVIIYCKMILCYRANPVFPFDFADHLGNVIPETGDTVMQNLQRTARPNSGLSSRFP